MSLIADAGAVAGLLGAGGIGSLLAPYLANRRTQRRGAVSDAAVVNQMAINTADAGARNALAVERHALAMERRATTMEERADRAEARLAEVVTQLEQTGDDLAAAHDSMLELRREIAQTADELRRVRRLAGTYGAALDMNGILRPAPD